MFLKLCTKGGVRMASFCYWSCHRHLHIYTASAWRVFVLNIKSLILDVVFLTWLGRLLVDRVFIKLCVKVWFWMACFVLAWPASSITGYLCQCRFELTNPHSGHVLYTYTVSIVEAVRDWSFKHDPAATTCAPPLNWCVAYMWSNSGKSDYGWCVSDIHEKSVFGWCVYQLVSIIEAISDWPYNDEDNNETGQSETL